MPALLGADPRYQKSYYASRAAANQWALAEPVTEAIGGLQYVALTRLAAAHQCMAFDSNLNLPHGLAAEQLLASKLSRLIETIEQPRMISIVRIKDLFASTLNTASIDQRASPEQQLQEFVADDSEYVVGVAKVLQSEKYAMEILDAMDI
jgi:hypothetical protein